MRDTSVDANKRRDIVELGPVGVAGVRTGRSVMTVNGDGAVYALCVQVLTAMLTRLDGGRYEGRGEG